ncbi:MAG: 4Fe-4S binding protein [Methanobrevibacter sp.]|nr:4Fe-4S binding protein [Methanobrevibacter sp.]
MKVKLKKDMKDLQREVILKSVDLDDDIDDFKVDIGPYEVNDKYFTVSPRCVRCNICFEECPVHAISPSTPFRISKIQDNCVKCEICAQSCPISCIYVMETKSVVDEELDGVEYKLEQIKVPHRVLRMESISIDRNKCKNCGHSDNCIKFCPTNAITLKSKSFIEESENIEYPFLEDKDYPFIDKDLCIGCGSCVKLCNENIISLDRILGPILKTRKLSINQDTCVQCYLCEETCPAEAIRLEENKIILDEEKCIRCNVCSSKCPVNALTLENVDDN